MPILNFSSFKELECIPITLLFDISNIGDPDEPLLVLHTWFIIKSSFKFFIIPYDTAALKSSELYLKYWSTYIFLLYKSFFSSNILWSKSI